MPLIRVVNKIDIINHVMTPSQAAAQVLASDIDHVINDATGDVTFSGMSIGTASATRRLYIAIGAYYYGASASIDTVEVDGAAATFVNQSSVSVMEHSLWCKTHSSGTTANVRVVAAPDLFQFLGVAIVAVDGVQLTPTSFQGAFYPSNQADPYNCGGNITVPANGFGFGSILNSAPPGAPTWSNMTGLQTEYEPGSGAWAHSLSQAAGAGAVNPEATGADVTHNGVFGWTVAP